MKRFDDALTFVEQLLRRRYAPVPLVLVNLLPAERLEGLREKFSPHPLEYVFGDYSREDILEKAGVRRASTAVTLTARHEGETAAQVDQRSLLPALTIRDLHPKLRIIAEILLRENRTYLEQAGVEEVLLRGQYDSSLLASAAASPGLCRIFTAILAGEGPIFWTLEVPPRYHGCTVKELADHLQERHEARLVAIYTAGRAISLEELLSDEPSPIDNFIRTKFAETGMTHLFGRAKFDPRINPPGDLVLGPHQQVVVIASHKPSL
ncbi:MAG: hypothetical protein FJ128_06410 [Deltaproteobacteria bacterium]|nr:hypothetical protein [Deltaproteobacteria bacterium]